jgi:hypothetical protein
MERQKIVKFPAVAGIEEINWLMKGHIFYTGPPGLEDFVDRV